MNGPGFLRLNRMRVLRRGQVAYDQDFHNGVNIIRGQNGSGKSTIADFIFFILGGEFDDWKDAASQCDEAQAEVETPRGKLTLRRRIIKSQEPVLVYFGPMSAASESSLEGWEPFPIHRHGGRESFSQVMFRSLLIPEAPSEGAANITMHQLLRLCYSDQRTPATRLFRFEPFDTQNIREAVGDLICGMSSYEVYEIGLELRELQKQVAEIDARLKALHGALLVDQTLDTPDLIRTAIENLTKEGAELRQELANVDDILEPGEVKEYLAERRTAQELLIQQREKLQTLELDEKTLEFELREICDFMEFLDGLKESLTFAEATAAAVGSIDFTRCPACGESLDPKTPKDLCILCKTPVDPDNDKAQYNQIRLDLEIQSRESNQLREHKKSDLDTTRNELRRLRRQHEKDLSAFDLKYASANGPREAFLGSRINRLGHIDADVDFLLKSLETAEEISKLTTEKAVVAGRMSVLETRNEVLHREAQKRRPTALSLISDIGSDILRADLPRQPEFAAAANLNVNFQNDSISVGGLVNFAESSNVILKNAAILALFLAASTDPKFNHPRFLLIDNIEDKGMEELRSHLFQRIIVDRSNRLTIPYQVIFTTSMMNRELELADYTIGPAYTSQQRSLALG